MIDEETRAIREKIASREGIEQGLLRGLQVGIALGALHVVLTKRVPVYGHFSVYPKRIAYAVATLGTMNWQMQTTRHRVVQKFNDQDMENLSKKDDERLLQYQGSMNRMH